VARSGGLGDVAAITPVYCLAAAAVHSAVVADANKFGVPLDGIVYYVSNGSAFKA
jgi:hypothetical protein